MCSVWIKIHSFSRYFSGLVYILQKRRTVFQKQKFTILPICQSAQLQVNDCKHFQEIGSNSLLCILSNYNLLLHCIFIQINQKKVQGQGEGDMKHKTKMSCLQFTLTFIYSTFCGKKRRGLFPLPTDTTLLFPVMCFSAAAGCSLYLYWILSVVRPLRCGENSKKWVNLCREKMRKCGEMGIGQEGGGQA